MGYQWLCVQPEERERERERESLSELDKCLKADKF